MIPNGWTYMSIGMGIYVEWDGHIVDWGGHIVDWNGHIHSNEYMHLHCNRPDGQP